MWEDQNKKCAIFSIKLQVGKYSTPWKLSTVIETICIICCY